MRAWRRLCRTLHREFGFLAVGMTVVYAVSGIAVNHAHQWDPSYRSTETSWTIEPPGRGDTADVVPLVLRRLSLDRPVKNTWRAGENLLQVFLDGERYDVELDSGRVILHGFGRRPLLYDLDYMHLNTGKGAWTGIADAYAGILILLATTGVFLVRGRRGLSGRGGVLMVVGFLVPLVYALLTRA